MMETAFLALGLMVGVPLLFAVALVLGLGLSLWETWWLYPAWVWLLVPLGVPAVSFWTLAALNIFVSALWIPVQPTDYKKSKDKVAQQIGRLLACIGRPVVCYYVIHWMVSR